MNFSNEKLIESSYWIAGCRAKKADISKDVYAKYWTTPNLKYVCQDYMNKVSEYEDVALSLRFRYLFDLTERFCTKHQKSVFVNIASGLSSYSLLLPKTTNCIEVDHESVLNKKKKLYRELGLETPNISWVATELLNRSEIEKMFEKISDIESDSICFVFEGILYYLPQDIIDFIFLKIANLPHKFVQVAINTWPKSLQKTQALKSLVSFTGEQVRTDKFNFHNTNDLFIKDFNIKEVKNYIQLFKEYVQTEIKPTDNVLWEEFVILERS